MTQTQTIEFVVADEKRQEYAKQFIEASEPKKTKQNKLTINLKGYYIPVVNKLAQLPESDRDKINKAMRESVNAMIRSAFMMPTSVYNSGKSVPSWRPSVGYSRLTATCLPSRVNFTRRNE